MKIYTTYFEILETQAFSENNAIFMVIILNMQLIFMTTNSYNVSLASSAISSVLPISDYVLLYPVILQSNTLLFNLLFLLITFLLLVFLMVTTFYLSVQTVFDSPFIKQLKTMQGFLSELADKILLVPTFGLMVGNLNCSFTSSQTTCGSGIYFVLSTVSVINSILLFFLELFYSYLFFNFTFKIKDSLSRNPSGMPAFFFIYRLAVTIYQSLFDLTNSSTYSILVFLHLVLGFIMLYDCLNDFPYHNKNVSKTQGIFVSIYLWINGTFMVLQLTQVQMLQQNVLIIMFLGMAFFLKLFLNIRNYFVKVLMNSELDEISSAVLLDLKIRNYNTLAKTLDIKKSELLLASLLKIHYDKCKNQTTCPCRRRSALIDPKKKLTLGDPKLQLHKDGVFVKHFIARMAKDGLNKFKDSQLLYLDFMFYRFEALRLYSSIYFEISKFESKYHNDMSLSVEFCLFRLRSKLKKYLKNRNQKQEISKRLLVQNVKYFDEGIIKQKENIMNVNKYLNDLWECLLEEKPDLSKLLEIGNQALQNITTTTTQYEYLLTLNNQSQDLLNLMTIFATYLTYDDLLSKKIEKDIENAKDMENDNSLQQDIKQLIKKYQVFDKQSCVLCISPALETLGQIVWCSRNAKNVFDYEDSDLLNMNINQLMPEPFSLYHTKILKYFYENGRENLSTKLCHLWAIDSSKTCFSANLYVKIMPSLHSFDVVGFVHKLNQDDYIVTDIDGMMFSVGRKVSDYLKLSCEFVSESRVNIQLLAPTTYAVFKPYFTNFEIMTEQKLSYEESPIEEIKFFFLINKDNRLKIQSFIETRQNLFKKFNIDLYSKENLNYENAEVQQVSAIKTMIKAALDFRKEYASLFYKVNKQIMISKLESIVKIKAQIKTISYWNGSKVAQIRVFKVASYESKSKQYIEQNQQKVRDQEKILKMLHDQLKKDHTDYKTKKMKMKEEEEGDQFDEIEVKKEESDAPIIGGPMKGFLNMFKKGGKQQKANLFNKFNKGVKGQTAEQTEEQLKMGILDTLFKNKKKPARKTSKMSSSLIQPIQSRNLQFDMEDEEEKQKRKIDATPEQIEGIRSCGTILKIQQILYKQGVIGQTEWSAFCDAAFVKKMGPVDLMEQKFGKIRAIIKTKQFKELVLAQKKKHEGSDSSNTDEEHEDVSQRFDEDQSEERSLLKNLQNNQGVHEEDKAAMQSVSSSTQSLQATNAQRMLREQLKNMKAPTVLIVAHYTMIGMCLLLFSLMISQFVIVKQDFDAVKQELDMMERVSNYSNRLIELIDGYYTLQQVNEGPLKNSSIYTKTWITQYITQLQQTSNELQAFFLSDFTSSGSTSGSGHDLRGYLFLPMQAQMLVSQLPQNFTFNFQNYVRLFLNAVQQTISSNITSFSMGSTQDYFYFIYQNLNPFIEATNANYLQVISNLNDTRDQMQVRFYLFWAFEFFILFLLYLFIYPIILRTKEKISETLKLFTMISIANVEYYASHYKVIFYMFKTIHDTATLMKKVEDDFVEQYAEKKKKDQQNNQKTLARARAHKGIQINKIVFFSIMTFWLGTFGSLVVVKDIFVSNFVTGLTSLNAFENQQHQMKFEFEKLFVQFKNQYFLVQNGTLNQTALTAIINEINEQQIGQFILDIYDALAQYSTTYSTFMDAFTSGDACDEVSQFQNTYPNVSNVLCEALVNQLFNYTTEGFYQQLKNDMLQGLNQISTSNNLTLLSRYLSQQQFQDYVSGFYYARLINEYWAQLGRGAYANAISQQLDFNMIFVIVISIIIFAFLFLIWGREFSDLKRNSRWVNGFILLIPTELRSENKKINSFLKNQLKIQGLMYV